MHFNRLRLVTWFILMDLDVSGDPVAPGGVGEPGELDEPDGASRRLHDWEWVTGLFLERA